MIIDLTYNYFDDLDSDNYCKCRLVISLKKIEDDYLKSVIKNKLYKFFDDDYDFETNGQTCELVVSKSTRIDLEKELNSINVSIKHGLSKVYKMHIDSINNKPDTRTEQIDLSKY